MNENDCTVIRGPHRHGYPCLNVAYRKVGTHVLMWTLLRGPIPKGMVIDHKCRNTRCCNIKHLRIATPKQNATENSVSVYAKNAAKTECPKCGGQYTTVPRGTRYCRPCFNAYKRERKKRLG